MPAKIVVFGSYVTDLTGRGSKFPVPGETVLGSSFKPGPGGKGSNQAVAAHRAGGDIALVTKLGRDAFGKIARDFYESEGMSTAHLLEDEKYETGAALIMVNEETSQNMIMVMIGACDHITHEDVEKNRDLIADAEFLLVQLEINTDALAEAIDIAYENGTCVILNPAPAQPLPPELLRKVTIITPNETEAALLTGVEVTDQASAEKAARVFLDAGVEQVVITLGGSGVYCTDGHRSQVYPRLTVNAVDTTGAGDAFNGGFVTALSKGADLFTACQYGNCTGALSVTRPGTAPAMPPKAEIDAMFEANYGKLPF